MCWPATACFSSHPGKKEEDEHVVNMGKVHENAVGLAMWMQGATDHCTSKIPKWFYAVEIKKKKKKQKTNMWRPCSAFFKTKKSFEGHCYP